MEHERKGNGRKHATEPVRVDAALAAALNNLGAGIKASESDYLLAKKRPGGGFQAAKENWLKVVARHPNLSGADCAVAITISTYLNSKTGIAWPSIERLARDTNRDRSTVWRSIERLEKLNLLGVERHPGRNRSNRYRPMLGDMNRDPKTLRRRNTESVSSKQQDCETAVRTLEEV
ncbi:MAG: helix-turn-helix domain-containing protein [Hyphomicrobiales bacterium]